MPGASRSSILAGGDRLSSLPDCLLHHIMSFMKARQVVQTCVLSTRWEHLRTLPQHRPGGDFTDHLIIPNNISLPLLDTFQLHISHRNCYQGKAAARWIHHGIKYNAQEPSIQRQGLSSSSWRLERLSFPLLERDIVACFLALHEIKFEPRKMAKPRVDRLSSTHLAQSVSENPLTSADLDLDILSPRCNVYLRYLSTRFTAIQCSEVGAWSGLSVITSPTLQSLIIHIRRYTEFTESLLVITAPVVTYLLLDMDACFFEGGVSLEEMPSLAKASIHLKRNYVESKLDEDQFKLLFSVSNVTSLVLSGFETMILEHFLQSSPNLKKLTLCHCKFSKDPKKKKRTKAKLNKGCLNQFDVRCKNLKYTEIVYEDDDVKKLVELLLSISESAQE
ncbi:hypothetical protein SETIT_7G106800v2 [Setaria italica]|uniref:F-box domain-containing protein n=1 Tax=Setaria italica TaxID=4555 RepID=A0A368RU75_SETIT|nr:hypothetical protein SETIT_7G106800v2 [Setaria italica]